MYRMEREKDMYIYIVLVLVLETYIHILGVLGK
jgi:hypothetical protein